MTQMVGFGDGDRVVFVNPANVRFLKPSGENHERTSIHFDKEQYIYVNGNIQTVASRLEQGL